MANVAGAEYFYRARPMPEVLHHTIIFAQSRSGHPIWGGVFLFSIPLNSSRQETDGQLQLLSLCADCRLVSGNDDA